MRSLNIEHCATADLLPRTRAAIQALCEAAYREPMTPFLVDIGPGDHLLGWLGETLVSHLMWVTRWLQPAGWPALRTAYVELVATDPTAQRLGYSTQLLESFPSRVQDLYTRLGWRLWRGPLAVREGSALLPTPEDRVMVLDLPRTPKLDETSPLSGEWRPGEVW
jgi:GNAT superfamily N-acetyltransferase